jgi:hypothetical protein
MSISFGRAVAFTASLIAASALLASCGGGTIENPPITSSGGSLSFAYFEKCVNPIFIAQLPVVTSNGSGTNSCAGSGCHDTVSGAGGAFRVVPAAQAIDVTNPANTPDVIRASDMYKNFFSAQGEVIVGNTTQSRIVAKPLLLNVLHGGGLIFSSQADPNVKLMQYWISHPVPAGQDEFSLATNASLFSNGDPNTGTCNTQ